MDSGIIAALRVKVRRVRPEAMGVVSFELVSADGQPLPPFSAGSHVDVRSPGGPVRQYSLCNDPAEAHRYVIGVLREPNSRGGSAAMHETVVEGTCLEISAPKNHFPLAQDAQFSLLLAGGIGITPILSMAEHLGRAGSPFELHYCTRSASRTAFKERIEGSRLAARTHFHFDDGLADQKLDLERLLTNQEPGAHLYVCGPSGFMEAVLSQARRVGWPDANVHSEFFAGQIKHERRDEGFTVQLASNGKAVSVKREQTVLQALTAAGVEVPSSCEQGVCGTCCTRIIEGIPDHRDLYFTDEERAANDRFLPCCSRAITPVLVLDL